MTKPEFAACYVWLCAALREPQDETGLTQQVYYQALGDLAPESLQGGATALSREPGRKWFPTTAEWRTAAGRVQTAHRRLAVSGREEPWRVDCDRCEDTCWRLPMECPGDPTCGRPTRHLPHTYTDRCACWPANRTFQRHHASG